MPLFPEGDPTLSCGVLPPVLSFPLRWEWHSALPRGALQIITDVIGNPEEERRAAFYHQPWAQEAVGRHIFAKVRRLCPG